MLHASRIAIILFAAPFVLPATAAEMSEATLRAADAEQMRIIVDGDAAAQRDFMHENYILNAPANRVLRKPALVEMLSRGEMSSERFERTIEGMALTGNIGVVMGSETVQPSADSNLGRQFGNRPLRRRFTNVFIFEKGRWYFLARQASVVEEQRR